MAGASVRRQARAAATQRRSVVSRATLTVVTAADNSGLHAPETEEVSARVALDGHHSSDLVVTDPFEVVDDRLAVVDHSRCLRAIKFPQFDHRRRAPRAACLLHVRKPVPGDRCPADGRQAQGKFDRQKRRLQGNKPACLPLEQEGVGSKIRMKPFAEPLQIFEHAVEGMTGRNAFALPKADHLRRQYWR